MESQVSVIPSNEVKTTDVVVIGAGLSGLQAGQKIQATGLSCHILEATGRVGGKARSIPSKAQEHGVNDVGAAWINDTNQSEMIKLFSRYNVQGVVQRAIGNTIHELGEGAYIILPYGESAVRYLQIPT